MLIFVTNIIYFLKLFIALAEKNIGEVYKRICKMLRDLKDEKVILEIKELISGIQTVKNEVNIYCDLMKQMFLTGSLDN